MRLPTVILTPPIPNNIIIFANTQYFSHKTRKIS
nr:MAG TPA: hypothetical protein [Caudoviricetes sp.]